MRTMILWLVAAAALMAPVAALADTTPTAENAANQFCKQQQATLKGDFAKTYGTNANKANAFGKCVSRNAQNASSALGNAAAACKAERAANAAAFAAKYGTNGKDGSKGADKNALGKCISGKVSQAAKTSGSKAPSALKQCKTARKTDAAAFTAKYGSGENALGKCVSAAAKA